MQSQLKEFAESLLSISFTSSLSRYGGNRAVGAMAIINSIAQLVTTITFLTGFNKILNNGPKKEY